MTTASEVCKILNIEKRVLDALRRRKFVTASRDGYDLAEVRAALAKVIVRRA